jgi:2-hydroxy-3-keto-5-methylthiopentenyl-1-phosphate phosphatase
MSPRSTIWNSRLPEATVRIYSDFDGTIVQEDVGELLFRHFCGDAYFDEIRSYWNSGALTAMEAYAKLCAAIPQLSLSMLENFLSAYSADPSFARFVTWCDEKRFPVFILSDGLDLYIDNLLAKAGVVVPYASNKMHLSSASPRMEFPFADARCPALGNCKSNHVALRSRDDDVIVYIGDGASDFEAAQYADLVFARGDLETYCQEQNISFRRFSTFTTVREVLSLLISQRKLRKRKHAEILRRQLWASG